MAKYTSSKQTLRELGEIALLTDIVNSIDGRYVQHKSRYPEYTYYTVTYKNHTANFQCDSRGYISVAVFIHHYERYL